jgi:dTDP-4-dehydrorhamnose 3,5-epimerase
VTNFYSPTHDRGIRWNDPGLSINWGIEESAATLSAKDKLHPTLREATDLF